MKRFILLFTILFSVNYSFGQANLVIEAPLNDNTGGINRGPNGTAAHAFLRGCYLVAQSELVNIPIGTSLTSFGFTMSAGATGAAASGNFTVYLQNTGDVTYQKGTNWSTAITSMTTAFASVMTVPLSPGVTTSVAVVLSTPVTYTGGGLYVAYDWASAGPFNVTAANYLGETTAFPLPAGGGANFASNSSAPTTMTLTNSRPAFLFGFANPNSNDIRVWGIEAPGKIAASLNTPHIIKAYLRNSGTTTQTNFSVSLNVTGANLFSTSQLVASLAPGAYTLVPFTSFNPQLLGANTISVSVPNDQNNFNNSLTYAQNVNCDTWAQNPATGTYTNGAGFATGSGIIATSYYNPVASSLVGINLHLSADPLNVGQQLYGVLMNATGVIIATSNTLTVTSGMLGALQTFSFSPGQSLSAATLYNIGIAQYNPTPVAFRPFGYRSSYYTPQIYTYAGIAAGTLLPLVQNFGYFGIEAVLGSISTNLAISSTPSAVCVGLCATLNAPTGLTNVIWSTGSTGTSINACPTATSNIYMVAGTNTLGCPATASIAVGINPLPNVAIASSTNAICIGSSISFTANGANTYSLNNIPSPSVIIQNPTVNTSYLVGGTDANGCVNTASIDITVYSLTVSVTSNTAICKGKSVTLSATSPVPYTPVWTNGILSFPFMTANPSPTATTTYSFIATDVNGCSLTSTVLVTVNSNPTVSATSSRSVSCKGEPVTITANGATSYTWSTNSNSVSITVSPINNISYIVTGANVSGCTHSFTVLQVVNPCTSLTEEKNTISGMNIYPNPNNGVFSLSTGHFESGSAVWIYNSLGALIKQIDLGGETAAIDISAEANGIYLVLLRENNKTTKVSRIIKQ
ncbi:MAG: T9SS type A sorting domain-containing protein [Bacteroidota bacterium]